MTFIRVLAMSVLMLAGFVLTTNIDIQPAQASCAGSFGPGGVQSLRRVLATAPVVFVGRVVGTSNGSRTATVRVDEVWRGKHVSRRVVVLGSSVEGNRATSVDRIFRVGVRYLFVPESTSRTSPFWDNNCTPTQPYRAALAKYRPHNAHRP